MRVLAITHSAVSNGGLFCKWLAQSGHETTRYSIRETGEAPKPGSFDAVVVFGGGMNVGEYDRHPWLRIEEEFILRTLAADLPMLGICLGGQLMAHVCGGTVSKMSAPEFLFHPVELTEEGTRDALTSALPARFDALEWHRYRFELPPEATLLARSERSNQAFRLGDHQWGLQFHPEGGPELTANWLAGDEQARLSGGGYTLETGISIARAQSALTDGLPNWNALGERLCRRFVALADARVRRAKLASVQARPLRPLSNPAPAFG